jgi:phosphoacetylglucosamine mutase
MLEASWEAHASTLANASTTDDLVGAIVALVRSAKIDLSKPARVVYGRDTRPSGPALVASLRDGLAGIGAEARDAGIVTTPLLHYLVRTINTKGTRDAYGDDSEDGYFDKLSGAFKRLVVSRYHISILLQNERLYRPGNKPFRR